MNFRFLAVVLCSICAAASARAAIGIANIVDKTNTMRHGRSP